MKILTISRNLGRNHKRTSQRRLDPRPFDRKEVNADRAIFLYDIYLIVMEKLSLLDDTLFAHYTLTRWLALFLLREALLTDPLGKELFENPRAFLAETNGRERLRLCIAHVTQSVVRLVNGEIIRHKKAQQDYFNYKGDLKNKEYVANLRSKVIPIYQIIVDGGQTESFSRKWKSSAPTP